jgi:glycosyltransferase involved in cell wall biosynthesis
MRVLFVAQSAALTGASHSMVDLVRGLIEEGHEALVILPESGPLEDILREHRISYKKGRARPWIGSNNLLRYWRRWWQTTTGAKAAVRMLRGERFDLVYTNTITSPFGAFIARDLGLPNVWQIRENMPTLEEAGPAGAYERARTIFNERSTLCVGNSKHIVSQIETWVGPAKTRLVYSGPFDDSETANAVVRRVTSGPPFRLLMIGRINDQKRQEDAIKALGILVAKGLDADLTLLGKSYGGRDQFLMRLADELGVGDRIQMPGYVPNPRSIYENSHVNLNCTEAEPLGRTILEGMAYGCPTVAANGGGTPEVIEHGVTGLLFRPGDWEALALHIETLLLNPEMASDISSAAQDRVLPFFTRSRYVEDMLQVFEEAMRFGKPAPSPKTEAVPQEV